ncbi:hypothetical protein TWF506_005650 [Arthrobotrys conoides]|uniref:Uncharacterized protein n=1 Tax=Arthrobotrys conoides TaxID=74498 RepID=A0AAN8RQ06_9PEZI
MYDGFSKPNVASQEISAVQTPFDISSKDENSTGIWGRFGTGEREGRKGETSRYSLFSGSRDQNLPKAIPIKAKCYACVYMRNVLCTVVKYRKQETEGKSRQKKSSKKISDTHR